MAEIRKRHIAYKVWIKDLLANKYVKQEGWDPNYVEIDGKQIEISSSTRFQLEVTL